MIVDSIGAQLQSIVYSSHNLDCTLGQVYDQLVSSLEYQQLLKDHYLFEITLKLYQVLTEHSTGQDLRLIATCEYLLFKLFYTNTNTNNDDDNNYSSGLSNNPYLIHFVDHYIHCDDINSGTTYYNTLQFKNITRLILKNDEQALSQIKLGSLNNDNADADAVAVATAINREEGIGSVDWIEPALVGQFHSQDEVNNIMQQLRKSTFDIDQINDSSQVTPAYILDMLPKLNIDLLISYCEPFSNVSKAICEELLKLNQPSITRMVISILSRLKANNETVDFVHTLIAVKRLIYDPEDIRVLVYEFVMFNLSSNSIANSDTIKLISIMILSIHRHNLLIPDDDYKMLYQSFVGHLAIDEARKVYLLANQAWQ